MIYKTLTALAATACLWLGGCQSTQSIHPPRGILGGFTSSVTDNIANATAGWEAFAFVGALMALLGGIMIWIFRSYGPGTGMLLTGFAVGGAALFMQQLLEDWGIIFMLVGGGVLVWWLSDEARRSRLRKHAARLFASGRASEALEVEREADPYLDKQLCKQERKSNGS